MPLATGASLLPEEARDAVTHSIAHFHAAGDVAGLTLTLYDLASVAVQSGEAEKAARLGGAARNLSAETGAGLATFTETAFEEADFRPNVRQVMSEAEIERLGAEGAAMTLDDVVAYALEGSDGGAAVHPDPEPAAGEDERRCLTCPAHP